MRLIQPSWVPAVVPLGNNYMSKNDLEQRIYSDLLNVKYPLIF